MPRSVFRRLRRKEMIFQKAERKKLPTALAIGVGALAVLGAVSVKNKGGEIIGSVKSKMGKIFKKKPSMTGVMNDMECEF